MNSLDDLHAVFDDLHRRGREFADAHASQQEAAGDGLAPAGPSRPARARRRTGRFAPLAAAAAVALVAGGVGMIVARPWATGPASDSGNGRAGGPVSSPPSLSSAPASPGATATTASATVPAPTSAAPKSPGPVTQLANPAQYVTITGCVNGGAITGTITNPSTAGTTIFNFMVNVTNKADRSYVVGIGVQLLVPAGTYMPWSSVWGASGNALWWDKNGNLTTEPPDGSTSKPAALDCALGEVGSLTLPGPVGQLPSSRATLTRGLRAALGATATITPTRWQGADANAPTDLQSASLSGTLSAGGRSGEFYLMVSVISPLNETSACADGPRPTCQLTTTKLPDGSKLTVSSLLRGDDWFQNKNPEIPTDGSQACEYMIFLERTDGLEIMLTVSNVVGSTDNPYAVSGPRPPLTVKQLTQIVTALSW
ncbi:MAG: hypothetical protein FWD74_09150 [Actinomycetia bacterium]|nr:hypothetical protein [Actinomycetes bacterium]